MRLVRVLGGLCAFAVWMGCESTHPRAANAPAVPRLGLQPLVRLGSVDALGASLSSVAAIEPQDSLVLVLESDPPRVAVFDRGGTWLRDIGGPGDGPGELRRPTHLGRRGDTIWVGDPAGGRLELFRSDGSSAGSFRWSVPPDSMEEPAVPTALFADGLVFAAPRGLMREWVRYRSYDAVTPGGEVQRRLYRAVVSPTDVFSAARAVRGGVVGRHPLEVSPLVAEMPDGSGIVVIERPPAEESDSSAFRVLVVGSDGVVRSDAWIPYMPTSAEGWLEQYLQHFEQELAAAGAVDRELLDIMRTHLAERRFYPPVTAVVGGTDGSIWVRREVPMGADSVQWQVVSSSGELEGAVTVASGLEVLRASRKEVWGVERNELDVPFVLGSRVVQVVRGAQSN